MHKFSVDVTVRLFVEAEDKVTAADVVQEMTYSFDSMTRGANIVDTKVVDTVRYSVED